MADETRETRALRVTAEALRIATAIAPLPPWVPRWLAGWIAAVIVGGVVALAEEIDVLALLRTWHDATRQEPGPASPSMPMPAGGMTLNQKPMEPVP